MVLAPRRQERKENSPSIFPNLTRFAPLPEVFLFRSEFDYS
jgi:hypothetical protein